MSIKLSTALCRVCLQSQISKGLSLFENYKHAPIFEHINLLTKLEIRKGDGLPNRICTICLLELEAVLNFTQKCRNSDFILRNNPGDIKLELPLEDEDQDELVKDEGPDDEPVYDDTGVIDDDDIYASILTDDIIPEKPGKPEFECHDCGNIYKSKCKLRVHWKNIHMPEQLKCKICQKQCKTYRSFHSHIKKSSTSCKISLKVNVEVMGKNRMYICKECNYKTIRPNSMKFHMHTHSNERPFICKICLKAFTQASSLSGHMETVHKQYKREITCQFCGKHVKGRSSVYRHLRTHKSMSIKCEVCSKVLKTKQIYNSHMLRHSGNKSFTCEICAKSFYTVSDLCNHKRTSHFKKLKNTEKPFISCKICEFKCRHKITLDKHTLKHTDSNVCCVKCGFFFDNEELWSKHQKCHTNLNYKCPECDKGFFSRDALGKHIKRVHSRLTSVNNKPRREKLCYESIKK